MYKRNKKESRTNSKRNVRFERAPLLLKKRKSQVSRNTSETNIMVKLKLDGTGMSTIKTGISFLDHMLTLFSKHGYFDLVIKAQGDLDVDIHHTNEDIALSLGEAFVKALRDKKGIRRFGFFYVPMEDALVRTVVDISNRPLLVLEGWPKSDRGGKQYRYIDCEHFLKSFTQAAGLNMHITVISGRDRHHVIEAVFKSLGRALDVATRFDKRSMTVPSTKGIL
ncbi:MAG: imidazoleglycerol-phosphate dehydratase HisB [Candidatus Omnitrophota bacterium]